MTEIFTVAVGYATSRPIIPDERTAWVLVATDRGPNDAQLLAAQMVGCHAVMPTSTTILEVEI